MNPGLTKRLLIVVIALVALAAVGLTMTQKPLAPAASVTTLKGEKLALESLRGKVVLVNFWATSCPGCVHEMPDLVKTYGKFAGRGLELVAVAMSYDPPDYVQRFSVDNRLPFTVALDSGGAAAAAFDARVTPTTFLIDKAGHIVQRFVGEPDFAQLNGLIEQIL